MRLIRLAAIATLMSSPAFAQTCPEGQRLFTDMSQDLCVPEAATRIVAMNDQILALPLYELGANVVGSLGRVSDDGTQFMRGGMDTLGIDYSNTDITFIGSGDDVDLELVASLEPDLIIALPYTEPGTVDQLRQIAPTPVLDETALGFEGTLRALADLTGQSAAFNDRFERYLSNVERAKSFIGNPERLTVAMTFTFPSGETLSVYRTGLGAATRVFDDLGFQQVDLVKDISENWIRISPELVQELDADFLIGFYRSSPSHSPDAVRDGYDTFFPGFCGVVAACQKNQMILLPSMTYGGTMASLETALELIESHVAARGFDRISD